MLLVQYNITSFVKLTVFTDNQWVKKLGEVHMNQKSNQEYSVGFPLEKRRQGL